MDMRNASLLATYHAQQYATQSSSTVV